MSKVNKYIMLDIESTGIIPEKEDLLQVGLLEVTFIDDRWIDGRRRLIQVHSDRQPESAFAKEHMVEIYKKSNSNNALLLEEVRGEIIDFAAEFDMKPPNLHFMGWNAGMFDVPFLVSKGALIASAYEQLPNGKEKRIGDFHYRVYDIQGAIQFTMNVMNLASIDEMKKKFDTLSGRTNAPLPEGQKHDALYDCVSQMNFLNDMLLLVKGHNG